MERKQDILEALATHQALTDTPQVWLDVSHGTLTPEAAASLIGDEESPELVARSKALFAPPSVEAERRIRARALEHATRSRWGWILGGGGLALAAGLVAVLSLRAPSELPPLGATYRVELSEGLAEVRDARRAGDEGERDTVMTYRRDQRVTFTLRPSRGIDEPELTVAVLAADEHGHVRALGGPRRVASKNGTVRITERIDALGLSTGDWELVFVVGRPGQVPTQLEGEPQPHHAVSRARIRVIDDGP